MKKSHMIEPLTNVAQFDILCNQVDDARLRGDCLPCGNGPMSGNGYFYQQILVTDVTKEMDPVKEFS